MNKIKEIRELRGLDRKDLAPKIPITVAMLGCLENGTRSLTEKYINKISEILNCTKSQLLGEQPIEGLEKNKESEKKYVIKEEYISASIDIIDSITDAEELTKEERVEILGKVYKLVHDFYELPNGKKEFISYIKKALETENEEKITHAKKTNK